MSGIVIILIIKLQENCPVSAAHSTASATLADVLHKRPSAVPEVYMAGKVAPRRRVSDIGGPSLAASVRIWGPVRRTCPFPVLAEMTAQEVISPENLKI